MNYQRRIKTRWCRRINYQRSINTGERISKGHSTQVAIVVILRAIVTLASSSLQTTQYLHIILKSSYLVCTLHGNHCKTSRYRIAISSGSNL